MHSFTLNETANLVLVFYLQTLHLPRSLLKYKNDVKLFAYMINAESSKLIPNEGTKPNACLPFVIPSF